ncbi:hypothetical protein L6164_016669 [Bauhinia variegata]|uniref:Uncharacterized protein n=1 Tax=Bauhinia variegata TaxID=167791 RepID=A0ACB9NRY7_BAUVA|nr:hypothetical protein L6164_016669 [Bauhinia variegata]
MLPGETAYEGTVRPGTSQEPGQSVNEFLAEVQPIWNQLAQANISAYHLHLIQVLMALRPEYEVVRASLLHRHPLPTLDTVVQEIIFEETRLGFDKSPQFEIALATTQSKLYYQQSGQKYCKNCHTNGHTFSDCPIVECRYCHKSGHILENCPTRPPKPRGGSTKFKDSSQFRSFTAATTSEASTTIIVSDLEALLKQVLSSHSSSTTALPVTQGKSLWLFDSACCNRMTSTLANLSTKTLISSLPPINTANALNLISVGQLCDLGLNILFSSSGCQFLSQQGTLVQCSCPHTSQQNGRAERKHRHILDTVRTLLISATCPEKFWREATLTAVYIINRVPTQVLNNLSPFERLFGKVPDYSIFKPFGCVCFVLLHPHEHTKLEPRSRLCCFLGYGTEHKGYRCWDPILNRLSISRHVTFLEHTMFSSLSKFHQIDTSPSLFFTDSSVGLFPTPDIHEDQSTTSTSVPTPNEVVPPDDTVPDDTLHCSNRAKYALDILSRAGIIDSKIVSTPLELNAKLVPMDGVPLDDLTLYRQLVGSLVYLTVT